MKITNYVRIAGRVCEAPELYKCCGEKFWSFKLATARTSGTIDIIPVNCPIFLLEEVAEGDQLCIEGQIRSYAKTSNGESKLQMVLFATKLHQYSEDENAVELEGQLCCSPRSKKTPSSGRELCYAMLAVNREHGKSDYIPQLFWGRAAKRVFEKNVGATLSIKGRMQSRTYQKGQVTRTVYEVSVSQLEEVENNGIST